MSFEFKEKKSRAGGTLMILLSALAFCCMSVFVALTDESIGVFEQSFFRNLIALIVFGGIAWRDHVPMVTAKKYWLPLFGRSLFGYLGVLCLFYASRHAAQSDVAILIRLSMFTISICGVVFLKEKLTKMHIPALLLAFLGAYIAADPSFDSSLLPTLAALGNALCCTVAYSLLAYFSGRVHPLTVVVHFCLFSTIASVPLMWADFVLPTGIDLFYVLMIGVCAAIGQISVTMAYRMAPASEVSIYDQAGILFSAGLGYVFLHQIPGKNTVLGGLLVIAASVMLYTYNRRHQQAPGT